MPGCRVPSGLALGSGDGFGVSGCSPLLGPLLSLAAAHWDCATPSCSGWCFRNSCYACQQRIPVLPWAVSTPVSQPRDTGDSQCSNPAQPQPVRGRAAWGRTAREPSTPSDPTALSQRLIILCHKQAQVQSVFESEQSLLSLPYSYPSKPQIVMLSLQSRGTAWRLLFPFDLKQ